MFEAPAKIVKFLTPGIRGPFHKTYLGQSYMLGKNFFLSSLLIRLTILVLSHEFPELCLNFKTGKSMNIATVYVILKRIIHIKVEQKYYNTRIIKTFHSTS